jgi:hypothetical protein
MLIYKVLDHKYTYINVSILIRGKFNKLFSFIARSINVRKSTKFLEFMLKLFYILLLSIYIYMTVTLMILLLRKYFII